MGIVCGSVLAGSDAGPRPPFVTMWGHDPDEAGRLAQARRSPLLPQARLPAPVRGARAHAEARAAAPLVSAIPVQYCRQAWQRLARFVPPAVPVLSVAKGIEVRTLLRPTQVILEALADHRPGPVGVLSGPTIAAELARCLPATMVSASADETLRLCAQRLFGTRWLRVYAHDDVPGVELAGATKNVIAIAAGILDGLQAGYNAKSALLARGLAEITRLGVAMGARSDTFFGLAGVGDLATSCFSPEGRNRSLGEALGRGEALGDYLARTPHVVEGVETTRSVVDLAARHAVETPIAQAVHAVLFDALDPLDAISRLMSRPPRDEAPR
jgi:glycerol-3-phosphate dehydrogenase (NAD(P)+)